MKKLVIGLIAISFSLLTFAQLWTVNPADFEFSMNITGKAHILGEIANDQNNYIGAFVNDVCVGVCQPVEIDGHHEFFYLTIYSNQSSGGVVEFKMEDAGNNITLFVNNVVFESDAIIGTASHPFLWMEQELYHSTDFLEFVLDEQVSPAEIDVANHSVNILVEHGTIINNLIPAFVLAPGASATVNSVEQESGVTANDYSSDVIYVVTGADQSPANWTVSVTVDNSDVNQFLANKISVYPNPASNYLNYDFEGQKLMSIQIVNLQGKIIKTHNCNSTSGQIDVSIIETGIYFVRFDFGGKFGQIIFEKL
jgi:hypothetical protein